METINIKEVNFKGDDIKAYVKELINADIRVFVHEENKRISWAIINKGEDLGYFQNSGFIGFSFSTKHKPNSRSGTGYQTEDEIIYPKIENALNTFVYKPGWAFNDNVEVIKYKGIDDYLSKEPVLKFLEVVL